MNSDVLATVLCDWSVKQPQVFEPVGTGSLKVTRLLGVVVEFCGRSERSIRTVKTNERDFYLLLDLDINLNLFLKVIFDVEYCQLIYFS